MMTPHPQPITVRLPRPHEKQRTFIDSLAPRKIIKAGRRGGKTTGMAVYAVQKFLAGRRVLYAAPTQEQIDRFWTLVTRALAQVVDGGIFHKNETKHLIELPGTEQRIRAKTAWNADTLRGDYADDLILDEFQLMNEDAWGVVGAPMLADNNGNAVFVYTPPSLRSAGATKAQDPRHASKMYKRACDDKSGRWGAFSFTSYDNPHISKTALDELAGDMTSLSYRMEIMAEEMDAAPGALWKRETIDAARVVSMPELDYIVVGVDPTATSHGDEAGIITAGRAGDGLYVIADDSRQGSPLEWARAAVSAYNRHKANLIVAESNQGGEMVSTVIAQVAPEVPVKLVHASRGKATRAEPVAAIYEQQRGRHVGTFAKLEDEMCMWTPGDSSPNRMDALVWAATELMIGSAGGPLFYE